MRWAVIGLVVTGCAFTAPENPAIEFAPGPRCAEDANTLRCDHLTYTIATGAFGWSAREVHLMAPEGEPPAQGWPAAILFQGSLHSAAGMWESEPDESYGGYHETELVRALLEGGFVVITPEARYDGATYWDTNVVPYNVAWETSEDHQLMEELLARIDEGELGAIDPAQLFAAGISSGGYMTSRVALAYPGRFRALAIQSASYATCSGPLCDVPGLPADHPPTLFLHGTGDDIVPSSTMEAYADALVAQGTEVDVELDETAGHQWLRAAPERIPDFFAQR